MCGLDMRSEKQCCDPIAELASELLRLMREINSKNVWRLEGLENEVKVPGAAREFQQIFGSKITVHDYGCDTRDTDASNLFEELGSRCHALEMPKLIHLVTCDHQTIVINRFLRVLSDDQKARHKITTTLLAVFYNGSGRRTRRERREPEWQKYVGTLIKMAEFITKDRLSRRSGVWSGPYDPTV
ncbi:hypothetical protein LTR66_012703 [Elasticomyces elasticus]|nr:hypothetical protein LTR66_012703 [Elasticomyces elasticus]